MNWIYLSALLFFKELVCEMFFRMVQGCVFACSLLAAQVGFSELIFN